MNSSGGRNHQEHGSEETTTVHTASPHPADSRAPDIQLRPPTVADAPAIHDLVVRSAPLDVNSRYAYLIWCRDFAKTSVVALNGGELAGFLTGYRPPRDPDVFFSWQSAVDPALTRPGLAFAMMTHVADQARREGARWFETTLNPGNRAVILLIRKVAGHYGGTPETRTLFDAPELGEAHQPEILYRFPLADPRD